jgi:hypothetical protein
MEVAANVLRERHPGFEPPSSVRSTGTPPRLWEAGDLPATVAEAVTAATPEEGRLAVIAPDGLCPGIAAALPGAAMGADPDLTRPVVVIGPRQAKGLEFDAVVVAEPAQFGISDLYVALTRATRTLDIVHTGRLPGALRAGGLTPA